MYREIGLLLVLLLPVAFFLLSKQDDTQQSTQSNLKKSKKKNKKKANKAVTKDNNKTDSSSITTTTDRPSPSTTRQSLSSDTPTSKSVGTESPRNVANDTSVINSNVPNSNTHSLAATPQQIESKNTTGTTSTNTKNKEVDEHMDMTARYSRVMRIRTETPDEPLSPVPYEDGWNQVGTAKPQTRSTQPKDEPLTKKQRENQIRAAKKKELKAQADAIQEQRLKKHQRQLEKEKMATFYSTGAGKHTQWGSKPRIPSNQAPSSSDNASSDVLDADDQLIWD